MQLFAKYYAISIYVMQIVTPSENTLRNKANFCANSSQRLKTFGFSWQHYIKNKGYAFLPSSDKNYYLKYP